MPGWGDAVGWIFDRLPNKKESLRRQIRQTQEQMDAITNTGGNLTASSADRYQRLSDKLRDLQKRLEEI